MSSSTKRAELHHKPHKWCELQGFSSPSEGERLKVMSYNPWSMRNKSDGIISLMETCEIDVCFIQESWLRKSDGAIIAEIRELGYNTLCYRKSRKIDRGGGVAVLTKSNIKIERVPRKKNFSSFEHIECTMKTNSGILRFVNVYYPGYSKKHKFTVKHFTEELSVYLDEVISKPGDCIIVGDFNIHVEKVLDPSLVNDNSTQPISDFLDMLDSFNLKQLVNFQTHNKGGTLDLVITSAPKKITDIKAIPNCLPSDHYPLSFCVQGRPEMTTDKKTFTFRNWKTIDVKDFHEKLSLEEALINPSDDLSLEALVDLYNGTLKKLADEFCPVIKKTARPRSNQKWFNNELKLLKRNKRKAGRNWQKYKTQSSLQEFKKAMKTFNDARRIRRLNFHKEEFVLIKHDTKQVFKKVSQLTNNKQSDQYPTHENTAVLCDDFAKYFTDKIVNIRSKIHFSDDSI